MGRSGTKYANARERVKALPWAAALQAIVAVGRRWRAMPQKDRARFTTLLRESRGWPGRLSDKERKELRKLAGKLDLRGMARDLAGLARGSRKRGGCRRRKS